ncbi:MAG: TIR domain-containing protein, partial [Candidatus Hodarchaeota archaeon]
DFMDEKIAISDIYVHFCSPAASVSEPMTQELNMAIYQNKLIIPVFTDTSDIPILLKTKKGIEASNKTPEDIVNDLHQFINIKPPTPELAFSRQKVIVSDNIARYEQHQGRYDNALRYYEESLNLANQVGDLRGQARALTNRADVYKEQGFLDKALTEFEEALTLADQVGDLRIKGIALAHKGRYYYQQKNHEEALKCYHESLTIFEQLGFLSLPETTPPPFDAYRGDKPYIFVSYSHKNKEIVYNEIIRLFNDNYRMWYDEGISPANEWPEEIAKAIEECAFFLVFISPQAIQSKYVPKEIHYALKKNKRFLAVYLEKTELPPAIDFQISSLQAILQYQLPGEKFYQKLKEALPDDLKATNN